MGSGTRPRILAGWASHLSGTAGLGKWRGSWWQA